MLNKIPGPSEAAEQATAVNQSEEKAPENVVTHVVTRGSHSGPIMSHSGTFFFWRGKSGGKNARNSKNPKK